MKMVVTGAAGFIGSNISHHLVNDGHEVHAIDDLSLGHKENIPEDAEFHEVSILDEDRIMEVVAGSHFVFHQAAIPSVPRSVEQPLRSHNANATGTLSLLNACQKTGVEKLVYASSSSVYGNSENLPKRIEDRVDPRSPYAVGKYTGEAYCRSFHQVYGLRTTALRYFNVYGPRQNPDSEYAAVIPKFVESALESKPLPVHGDGSQTRDFTYIEDVIQANLKAAHSRLADGKAVNVGAGERTSILELAEKMIQITDSKSEISHEERRPGDVDHSLAGLERTKELIDYEVQNDLDTGLRKAVDWYKKGRN